MSLNLQAKYTIRFLFRLDLILHVCKILFQRGRFGILNFARLSQRQRIVTFPMALTADHGRFPDVQKKPWPKQSHMDA